MFQNQVQVLVQQIDQILTQLTDEEYTRPLPVFHNSTIGQHVRHVIEFFVELDRGCRQGLVDYDNRERNKKLETDKQAALSLLARLTHACDQPDRPLQLSVRHDAAATSGTIATTYYRELAFAIEHTVHHMALIRIGIEQLETVAVPANFGVAAATQRFRSSCAQ